MIQSLEHELFRGGVQSRRGFVQNKNRRVADDGAGNRNALPLAAREGHASLSQHRVISFRQLLDEFVGIRLFGGAQYLGAARFGLSVCDVLPDGSMEQNGFLQYKTDLLAKRFLPEALYIDAVNLDGSRDRIVEARNQTDDRRFAGACRPDERGQLSRFDGQAHVFENRASGV